MLNYSQIIRNSIDTVKHNYWLLVYGIILGGASSNLTNNLNFDREIGDTVDKTASKFFSGDLTAVADSTGEVLGAATNSFLTWLSSVPPHKWLFLGLVLIAYLATIIAFFVIVKAWATGGIINGIQMAHEGRRTTLLNTSPAGIKNIGKVIKLLLYKYAIYAVFTIVTVLIVTLIYFSVQSDSTALLVISALLLVVTLIAFLITSVVVNFAFTYALRFAVLKNLSAKESFSAGFRLFKNNVKDTFVITLINFGFSVIVGIALMVVFLPIGLVFFAKTTPSIPQMILAAWIVLLAVFVSIVVNAAYGVFINSNWNQAFNNLNHGNK